MKAIFSIGLADFIANVVAELYSDSASAFDSDPKDHFPQILIFCDSSFLENFQFFAGNVTMAKIHALYNINLVADASIDTINKHLRQVWFEPSDQKMVLAFYDILAETPKRSAYEKAPTISHLLYMLHRVSAHTHAPQVYVNIGSESAGHSEIEITSQMLNLISKWTRLPPR